MSFEPETLLALCLLSLLTALPRQAVAGAQHAPPETVPKIWDEAALADWATPLAGLGSPPSFYSEEEYYRAPVDNLRTYPVYHPDREPAGYRASLVARGPEPLIEPESLRSPSDWIAAGRRVFEELDTEVTRTADPKVIEYFSSAAAVDAHRDGAHDVLTKDGILLDYRWVVGRDGVLSLSLSSCAGCHSRLMPDGSVLLGAPCNFDLADSPAAAILLAKLVPEPRPSAAESFYQLHGVPWRNDDPHARFRGMSDERIEAFLAQDAGAPPGTTFARFNGSPLYAARMADLRGIRDRKYLDVTGGFSNRGPADLARYGILVEFADAGVFGSHRMQPETNMRLRVRPPDAAMYALGLFLDSLDPPPSPHAFDSRAERGRKVFEGEGCDECHPPPLYTNNELVPVSGFDPPSDAEARGLAISSRRVGTDPGMALFTRKGTGYYRVPTLRGLWYRGLFEHSGSVASLEDWFDPKRLDAEYRPSGWRGPGVEHRAVPGHRFGLDLPDGERADLIAFLLTL